MKIEMVAFLKKHKLAVDIFFFIVLAAASGLYWYDLFENGKSWKWLGGVMFGIMAIIKLVEIIMYLRKKNNLPSQPD
jgi:4-amino-4-deoxy-L-arabinose transferase-like glycosyltransferase